MSTQDHCDRLTKRLRSCGLAGSAVFHEPTEGYYVAPRASQSQYSAYGAGTEYYALGMTLAQAEAFVGGMCAAIRGAAHR